MTSERKVLFAIDLLFGLFHHRFLRKLVHRISVHVDRIVKANLAADIHRLLPAIDEAPLAYAFAHFASLADICIDPDLKK